MFIVNVTFINVHYKTVHYGIAIETALDLMWSNAYCHVRQTSLEVVDYVLLDQQFKCKSFGE